MEWHRIIKQRLSGIRLAAKQGNADAQYNLGLMYANGYGVAQNYKHLKRIIANGIVKQRESRA